MNEKLTCSNPDCEVAVNGSCLEGHDPVQSCPHFGQPTTKTAELNISNGSPDVPEETEPEHPNVRLPQGEPLSQLEVDAQLLQRPGRLVAIIGDTSSGKSTLLCSLYDRFQRGGFADRSFVASTTLNAFEKLTHLSRAISGAQIPDTERTYVSERLQYYHLALAKSDGLRHRADLFMSDRAGETYRSAMHRPEEFNLLPELTASRIVTVLIDGARLAQQEEQHEVLGSARRMVRAMVDANALSNTQHLQLVLTKRDEVERSGNTEAIVACLTSLVTRLQSDFGSRLATIDFFQTAARDPNGAFEPAHGCDALLTAWLDAAEPPVRAVEHNELPATQFDRLAKANLKWARA